MLKLSKKADYALIAVKHLASHRAEELHSAADIAHAYGISPQILAKVLQRLAKHGLVTARHGSSGGYMMITSCVTSHGACDQSNTCTVREPLRKVNESIVRVLRAVSISQMTEDSPEAELVGLPS